MRKTYTHDSCRILTHHLIIRETKSQRLGLYFVTSQRLLWAAIRLSRQAWLDAVILSGVAPFFVGFSLICSAVWAITPCNVVRESFGGKCCLNLQVRRGSLWQGLEIFDIFIVLPQHTYLRHWKGYVFHSLPQTALSYVYVSGGFNLLCYAYIPNHTKPDLLVPFLFQCWLINLLQGISLSI